MIWVESVHYHKLDTFFMLHWSGPLKITKYVCKMSLTFPALEHLSCCNLIVLGSKLEGIKFWLKMIWTSASAQPPAPVVLCVAPDKSKHLSAYVVSVKGTVRALWVKEWKFIKMKKKSGNHVSEVSLNLIFFRLFDILFDIFHNSGCTCGLKVFMQIIF